MVAALSLLSLYAAVVLPWSKIACCFLSSLFIYVLASEGLYLFSLICFMATAGLSALLLPDKTPLFIYLALLGHYGIFKTFAESKIKDKVIRFIAKLAYCDIFSFLALLAAYFLIGNIDFASLLPSWSWWLLLLALQIIFIAYDILYSLCSRFYDNMLRNVLIPRR